MIPSNRKPTHPGTVLEHEFLKPLGWAPLQLAEKLGEKWKETKVTAILQGREGISEKSAQDFAALFGTSPTFWNSLQYQYFQWAKAQRAGDEHKPKRVKKRKK